MMFVVSLDFELLWGVHDTKDDKYYDNLKAVYEIIPQLLNLFNKYKVSCTWGTVGALFASGYKEFEKYKPEITPTYDNADFDGCTKLCSTNKSDSKLLFAPELLNLIQSSKSQEVASHTFSHYYCLESGQTHQQFDADLNSGNKIAKAKDIQLRSIIFPRNQYDPNYLKICKENGFIAYRGNPEHWAYRTESRKERSLLKRAFRLLDSYLPLSGSLAQKPSIDPDTGMVNIPASLFLRPWNNTFSLLEKLKLWRIKWSLTQTAKKGGVFHLWWHPHNFGKNQVQNLELLEDILKHYLLLKSEYGMKSQTMKNIAEHILRNSNEG